LPLVHIRIGNTTSHIQAVKSRQLEDQGEIASLEVQF
jgi:hypothetical protein